MSKRGKDLFYLLEQRESGTRRSEALGATEAPEATSRPAAAGTRGSLTATVRQWFGGVGGRPARKRGARPEPGTAPFGLIVAAVGLLALGVGFTLGRFLPRAETTPDLASRGTEGAAPRRPGPLDADKPAPGAIAAEKEEEILSNLFFDLLRFSAPQRAEAAQAATFLRANGVDTARIRKLPTKSKVDVWVVLTYAPTRPAASEVLTKLRAVPASRAWPTLATDIGRLSVEKDLMQIE